MSHIHNIMPWDTMMSRDERYLLAAEAMAELSTQNQTDVILRDMVTEEEIMRYR